MRPWIRLVIAVALLWAPAAALGHATPTGAAPVGAATVRVQFSTPVEQAFLAARDASGPVPVRRDPADAQAVLVTRNPRGGALRLRILSRDGHVVRASLPLASGTSGASRDPLVSILADGLLLAGLVVLGGLVALRFAVIAPAWRSGGTRAPGVGGDDAWRALAGAALARRSRAWWTATWSAGALAAAGLMIAPIALLADLDEGAGELGTLLGSTRWGRAWLVQVAATAIALGLAAAYRRSAEAHRPDPSAAWGWGIGLAVGAALVATSASSHAAIGTDAALGIGIDALHLAACALWFGGLVGLMAALPAARMVGGDGGLRLAAAVVVRFSGLAIVAVAVLVVTGVYRAIGELSTPGDLLHTAYGQVLLVKLALFGVLLVSGASNRLVLHPRLERAAMGLRDDAGEADVLLRRSVAAEILLAALVIATVAVLVSLPTP